MDCLSYDRYEKVKDRQLKEKQMEKEAKPLPGKTGLKKKKSFLKTPSCFQDY